MPNVQLAQIHNEQTHYTSIHTWLEARQREQARIPAHPAPRMLQQNTRQRKKRLEHSPQQKVSTFPVLPVTQPSCHQDQSKAFHFVSTPLLTYEQERELLTRYQGRGDQRALEHLITSNIGLVASIAIPFARITRVDLEDLMQDGLMGLVRAIETFDLGTNYKLSTHATIHIRGHILRALSGYIHSAHMPSRLYYTLRKMRHLLTSPAASTMTLEALASETHESVKTVRALLHWLRPTFSLDRPVSTDGDTPLVEVVSRCDDRDAYAEVCDQDQQRVLVERLLAALSDERKRVTIRLCFGIGCPRLMLHEAGKRLHISKERVRQIRDDALGELRAAAAEMIAAGTVTLEEIAEVLR